MTREHALAALAALPNLLTQTEMLRRYRTMVGVDGQFGRTQRHAIYAQYLTLRAENAEKNLAEKV